MKKNIFIIFAYPIFLSQFAIAQSAINACSNSNRCNGITHTYSIGEMALVHTINNPHVIITQGLLQPSGGIANTANTISANMYPNPTSDIVYLEMNNTENCKLDIIILDANGKTVLQTNKNMMLGFQKIPISLASFANGLYVLKAICKTATSTQHINYKIKKQ